MHGQWQTQDEALAIFCLTALFSLLLVCNQGHDEDGLMHADPLVLNHQLMRDGAAADGIPGHHPHASPEERLHQIHA